MNYYFTQADLCHIKEFYSLIVNRVKWMDLHDIHQWNDTDYLNVYPLSYYERNVDKLYVLVDKKNHVVSGAILLEQDDRWNRDEPSYYIHNFVSDRNATGAGRIFIQYVESLAVQKGKQFIRLDSAVDNDKLCSYYQQLGFEECGFCEDGAYKGVLREKRTD